MKNEYRYSMIVSQMESHTVVTIVEIEKDFFEKAKQLTKELIVHKRGYYPETIYLGDFDYYGDDGIIMKRYNVNDTRDMEGSGDIYFLQSSNLNYLKGLAYDFSDMSRRFSLWDSIFNKKKHRRVKERHNKEDIKHIVQEHFYLVYVD